MKRYIKKIKKSLYIYKKIIRRETIQTKKMLITFKIILEKQMGGKSEPSKEDIKEAIKQLKDVGKITILTPLLFLPGSVVTIPLLVKIGKRYGIDILPS